MPATGPLAAPETRSDEMPRHLNFLYTADMLGKTKLQEASETPANGALFWLNDLPLTARTGQRRVEWYLAVPPQGKTNLEDALPAAPKPHLKMKR
jgi:hypothetical protein